MWQSQVENKHYSVVNFDCITARKGLDLEASIKSGAHTHCIKAPIQGFYLAHMRPTLNKHSVIKKIDAIKICDGIMFVFYQGLQIMLV